MMKKIVMALLAGLICVNMCIADQDGAFSSARPTYMRRLLCFWSGIVVSSFCENFLLKYDAHKNFNPTKITYLLKMARRFRGVGYVSMMPIISFVIGRELNKKSECYDSAIMANMALVAAVPFALMVTAPALLIEAALKKYENWQRDT